jgi:tetratricopeptide (TPR) repeat protein
MSAVDQRVALGRAIAEQRRRHGLSQAELAPLLGRPAGWVSLVERGMVQAEPIALLEAVASALGTPLPARHANVVRRPAGPAGEGLQERGSAAGGLPDAVGALGRVLSLRITGHNGGSPGRPNVTALRANSDRAWALTGAGHYLELARLLNSLLPDLDAALGAAPGPRERAGLHELLATFYQACAAALAKLGEYEGAKTAASRALSAAQRAGDLPMAAASAYLLARILMEMGRYPHAEETARKGIAGLGPLAARGRPEAISLQGALTLLRALIAARTGNPVAAEEQLSWARAIEMRLAAASSGRDTGFGAAQIALYETAVSLEASAPGVRRRGAA